MIGKNCDFHSYEIRTKLVKTKNYKKNFFSYRIVKLGSCQSFACLLDRMKHFFCPITTPTSKSLASHINSKEEFQSSVTIIEAKINRFFISSKASKHVLLNLKVVSFSKSVHKGLEIFEKSLINLQ